jgi:hypothetical protein
MGRISKAFLKKRRPPAVGRHQARPAMEKPPDRSGGLPISGDHEGYDPATTKSG